MHALDVAQELIDLHDENMDGLLSFSELKIWIENGKMMLWQRRKKNERKNEDKSNESDVFLKEICLGFVCEKSRVQNDIKQKEKERTKKENERKTERILQHILSTIIQSVANVQKILKTKEDERREQMQVLKRTTLSQQIKIKNDWSGLPKEKSWEDIPLQNLIHLSFLNKKEKRQYNIYLSRRKKELQKIALEKDHCSLLTKQMVEIGRTYKKTVSLLFNSYKNMSNSTISKASSFSEISKKDKTMDMNGFINFCRHMKLILKPNQLPPFDTIESVWTRHDCSPQQHLVHKKAVSERYKNILYHDVLCTIHHLEKGKARTFIYMSPQLLCSSLYTYTFTTFTTFTITDNFFYSLFSLL